MFREIDIESRRIEPETEYKLADFASRKIIECFVHLVVYLFDSCSNAKCKYLVSSKKDPGSVAIDACTLFWEKFFLYAFPPFAIILKVLNKMRTERAEGILVVSDQPTQPWYPVF